MTTASEAPMLTPRMPGSAIGFLVTPCMTAPETPRAPPTIIANSVLGMRFSTAACSMLPSVPSSAPITSAQPTNREPTLTDRMASTTSTATAISSHSARTLLGRRTAAAPERAGEGSALRSRLGVACLSVVTTCESLNLA